MTDFHTFNVGDAVEVRDYATARWMPAHIAAIKPYRGRMGYDFNWDLPKDAPMWMSRGGWTQETCVRLITR